MGQRRASQVCTGYDIEFVYNIPIGLTRTLTTANSRGTGLSTGGLNLWSHETLGGSVEPPRRRRGLVVRKRLTFIASLVVVLGATIAVDPAGVGASSPADQGVTSTTIRIGFPVINFPALAVVGVHLNDGNFQDAISALTTYMNAHGGIDGRKIVPYVALDDPAITASSQTVCTQLTEDDHVFIAIAPVYPDCYQVTHDTPVIDGTLPGTLPSECCS